MTTELLTDPLTTMSTDLRDFGYMPLDVLRLRDSDLASVPNAEVFRVAVLSWCVGWHQVPAASLPDDDPALARLLGFGRDLVGWRKVREEGGLRGWVKCSDGRLYHPVVAEKANEAWEAKQAQRSRTEAARQARQGQSQQQSHAQLQKTSQTKSQRLSQKKNAQSQDDSTPVTTSVTESKGREGKGEERKGEQAASCLPREAGLPAAGQDPFDRPHPDADDGSDVGHPRLRLVESLGGWLTDPKTGELLADAWLAVLAIPRVDGGVISDEQIHEVFKQSERLTGHVVRYPSGFTKALEALRDERRAAQALKDQAAAKTSSEERKAILAAEAEAESARCRVMMDAVEAWLGSAEGDMVRRAIEADPQHAPHLASARRMGGVGLSLYMLGKAYPELARVAAEHSGMPR